MSTEALKYSNGRLTPAGISELHRMRKEGVTYREISAHLNVCISTVYNLATGRTQRDLHPSVHRYAWAS